jgi:hypothetical protein
VYHYIYELVINLLVSNGRCYQLHQLLQYHVVRDSDHVACLLLSLVPVYPPAYQLAIDMLKRLGTLEDIVEVLLLKAQVCAPPPQSVAAVLGALTLTRGVLGGRLSLRFGSSGARTCRRACGPSSFSSRRCKRRTAR